jgi:hypothetical protein
MILTIFGILTAVEAVILALKISKILEYRDYAKQVGIHLPFYDKLDKVDKFIIRMYQNYKDLFWIFGVILLFMNLIISVIVFAIIEIVNMLLISF